MASSDQLLTTLDRINERMKKLEASFSSEISELRNENNQLRQDLAGIQQAITKPAIVSKKTAKFDRSAYMAGVFAYQKEDYKTAIKKFSSLKISTHQKRLWKIFYIGWQTLISKRINTQKRLTSLIKLHLVASLELTML
ncbi:MAG: hypothetical protein ACJZ1P_01275 [Candidatus Neomarinimicrobiota bacterium]